MCHSSNCKHCQLAFLPRTSRAVPHSYPQAPAALRVSRAELPVSQSNRAPRGALAMGASQDDIIEAVAPLQGAAVVTLRWAAPPRPPRLGLCCWAACGAARDGAHPG
jgi:hypothetical protein